MIPCESKYNLPKIPIITAAPREIITQMIAIIADFLTLLASFIAIKRTRI